MQCYDDRDPEDQMTIREQWSEGFARIIAELDFAAEFKADGSSYSELDGQGKIVTHPAGGPAPNR
jgi:hypothetical protein